MPRVVAIIQARMGSTRLPGKTLADVNGKPMLEHVVSRVQRCELVDEIVIATTTHPGDGPIIALCDCLHVRAIAGSEEDVLDRYATAARETSAEVIVRFTADCPLLDAALSDDVIREFLSRGVDFASNCLERTFPRGVETEVISRDLLDTLDRTAKQPYEREHVTAHLYVNEHAYRMASITAADELQLPELRLCVDTAEDLALIREIYQRLGRDGRYFTIRDVVELIDREPHLAQINAAIQQKPIL